MTSTTNEDHTLILKTDALGRVRMPKDRREAILDAFERSGMSGQAFAARIGVKYLTFATWVQRRRRSRGDYKNKKGQLQRGSEVTLFEAVAESGSSKVPAGALEVETVQGLKLRIGTSAQVALATELLQALEGRGDAELQR
jgi:transposase